MPLELVAGQSLGTFVSLVVNKDIGGPSAQLIHKSDPQAPVSPRLVFPQPLEVNRSLHANVLLQLSIQFCLLRIRYTFFIRTFFIRTSRLGLAKILRTCLEHTQAEILLRTSRYHVFIFVE